MDLFDPLIDPAINLLGYDGVANYYGPVIDADQGDNYLRLLLNDLAWRNDELVICGKHVVTRRKVAWYGDAPFEYIYSNTVKKALCWTEELGALKNFVEQRCGERFNCCLLNLYHSGEEGMGWHSDDEKEMAQNAAIASLSFGAERKFNFRHKYTKKKVSVNLQHGSLLLMRENIQVNWQHSLSKSKKVDTPRINLTFRRFIKT